jgi:hypothetical protein
LRKTLFASIGLLVLSAIPAFAGELELHVYVAYADSLVGGKVPHVWAGTPGVTCICYAGPLDSGAIGLYNYGDTPIKVDEVAVDIGPALGINPWWQPIMTKGTIAPRHALILAGTTPLGFDTSDIPDESCVRRPYIPAIHITTGTVTLETRTYYDRGQILNTGGKDTGTCPGGSEFRDWVLIN